MDREFCALKEILEGMKALVLINYDRKFMLRADGLNSAIAAVLLQRDQNVQWISV